jgi:hypothetical protein
LFKEAVLIADAAVGERERHRMPILRWQIKTPQDRQGHDQQHGKDSSASDAIHSRTSYSKATPSGSFSSNHVFRGVGVREHLQMLGVTDLLAGVDVDEDCHF